MRNYKKALVGFFSAVGTYSVAMSSAFAQQTANDWADKLNTGGPKEGDLVTFIVNLINWFLGAVALIAVVMLIISGVKYITAGGDEKKVEDATKGITNAIIGLVICFVAVLIVKFVIDRVQGTSATV